MNDTVWPELGGKRLEYRDRPWELTGSVSVEDDGRALAAEAHLVEESSRDSARLIFTLRNPPESLNPGNLGGHFDRIERTKRNQFVIVETDGRTYRYRLSRIEFD